MNEQDAAHRFVESMARKADSRCGAGHPLWHGWALREAYLAGVAAEREAWEGIGVADQTDLGASDDRPLSPDHPLYQGH